MVEITRTFETAQDDCSRTYLQASEDSSGKSASSDEEKILEKEVEELSKKAKESKVREKKDLLRLIPCTLI